MKLMIILFCLCTSVIGCGIRLPKSISSRHERAIIGGKNVTTSDKWPWQVLIRANINENNESSCGGTVIANQWILTAAHCVINSTVSAIAVFDGITHFDESDTLMANARKAIEVEIHRDYDPVTAADDIAVLKLAEPLEFGNKVASICLPNQSQSIPDDGLAVVSGFGQSDIKINGTRVATFDGQLREAIVPIVNLELCQELWSHANTTEEITEKIVCASSFARGIHKGDSGGPLMMRDSSGRWFQIGITSFAYCESKNCEKPGDAVRGDLFPKAFTAVRPYCEWIALSTGGEVTCNESEVQLEDVSINT